MYALMLFIYEIYVQEGVGLIGFQHSGKNWWTLRQSIKHSVLPMIQFP